MKGVSMVIIGVDPHKRLHVASVVEPATNGQVAVLQVEASLAGYRRLLKWGGSFGERRWAVENARGLGRHLASGLLTRVRPAGPVEAARKQLARDLVAEIRDADQRLKALTVQIADTVAATGSRLTEVDGVGPVVAARLLARTRRASRFPTAAAFASYAGVAPVEVSSAERVRHRLPRGGDRQLNFALHIVALTQVRMRSSSGRAYYDTKIAAGKTHNEAMRCLKRRLADHLWRLMIRDEGSQAAGPGGHQGATLQSSAAGSTPTASSSEKSLPEPATPDSTTRRSAA
jgi:transposase